MLCSTVCTSLGIRLHSTGDQSHLSGTSYMSPSWEGSRGEHLGALVSVDSPMTLPCARCFHKLRRLCPADLRLVKLGTGCKDLSPSALPEMPCNSELQFTSGT